MSVLCKHIHDSVCNACNAKTYMIVVLPNYIMFVQSKDRYDSGIAKLHNVCAKQRQA